MSTQASSLHEHSMADYDHIPANATLTPSRFRVKIPDKELKELKKLIELSKIGPKTYENAREDGKFGVGHQWLTDARSYWLKKYDWRATEAYINSFTQYEVALKDDSGQSFAIHFTGLFSQNPEAIPIIMLHGWPGSFMEFLKMLNRLRGLYSPSELPYHVVVPSLPGYAFSTGPPVDREWACEDAARLMDRLMCGLGFSDGYVAHGGDLGSMIARIMCAKFPACKAMHVNFNILLGPPEGVQDAELTAQEQEGLARAADYSNMGMAYAREHGTRPATIGLVMSTNPLAQLAWIGEKFLSWTDVKPNLDTILEFVTLYWLTSTFPRAMYPYVQFLGDSPVKSIIHDDPKYKLVKPFGYSWFPKELAPMPVKWVATTGNLIWSRMHSEGGHFAALEKPDLLLKDIEDFIAELK